MAIFLLFITILIFAIFFYAIGLRYLGLLPIVVFFVMIIYYSGKFSSKKNLINFWEKYGIVIAWHLCLAGLTGAFYYLGFGLIKIFLFLLGMNIIFFIFSFVVSYKDGLKIFQIGFYSIVLAILIYLGLNKFDLNYIYEIFNMLWILDLGLISFVMFVLGNFVSIPKIYRYKFFIICLGFIFLILIKLIPQDIYIALFVNSLILLIIYYLIFKVKKFKILSTSDKEDVSIRYILSGGKIKNINKKLNNYIMEKLHNFVEKIPSITKYFLEFINIAIIIILLTYYILNINNDFIYLHKFLFWIIIFIYILNVILLKKIKYTSILQKIIFFIVINFAIYISLYSIFGENYNKIVSWGVMRNLLSNLMIFYSPKTSLKNIFSHSDYKYWIITTVIAMVANIILLTKTNIVPELIFFMVVLYIGMQSMILYYAYKFLENNK